MAVTSAAPLFSLSGGGIRVLGTRNSRAVSWSCTFPSPLFVQQAQGGKFPGVVVGQVRGHAGRSGHAAGRLRLHEQAQEGVVLAQGAGRVGVGDAPGVVQGHGRSVTPRISVRHARR